MWDMNRTHLWLCILGCVHCTLYGILYIVVVVGIVTNIGGWVRILVYDCGTSLKGSCKCKIILVKLPTFEKSESQLVFSFNEAAATYSVQIQSLLAEVRGYEV